MLNDAIYVFFGHIRKDLAEHVAQKFAVLSKQTAFVVATQFYWTTVVKPLEVHVVAGERTDRRGYDSSWLCTASSATTS